MKNVINRQKEDESVTSSFKNPSAMRYFCIHLLSYFQLSSGARYSCLEKWNEAKMYIPKSAFTKANARNDILCKRIKICISLQTKTSTMLLNNLNKFNNDFIL